MVAGDFNAISSMWQSWGDPRGGDTEVGEWATGQGLILIGPYDEFTHKRGNQRGNVLDLVFSNITDATTEIETQLYIGSDHQTLVTVLLSCPRAGGQRLDTVPEDAFVKRLRDQLRHCLPPAPTTAQEVEGYAEAIIQAVSAVRTHRPTSGSPTAKWWTEEVRQAQRTYQQDLTEKNRHA